MFKWIVKVACFFMILGMTTSAFAQEDDNSTMNGEVSEERIAIIEMADTMQARGTIGKEQSLQSTVVSAKAGKEEDLENATMETYIEETVASEAIAEETIPEETQAKKMTEAERKLSRQSGVLTARKGIIRDSPCGPNGNDGQETWYPTHPGGAVRLLAKEKGFYDLEMTVCKEKGPRYGVRIISGYTPDGQYFENLVVVAADIKCSYNPDAAFERGDFIETSLGPGLIVDFCERAMNERRYNGITHIDIAVDW